jgi:NADH-quinone oxidoreductase subunit G
VVVIATVVYIGFAKVFDVSVVADMVIVEEADEFFNRVGRNKDMSLFASRCPV